MSFASHKAGMFGSEQGGVGDTSMAIPGQKHRAARAMHLGSFPQKGEQGIGSPKVGKFKTRGRIKG